MQRIWPLAFPLNETTSFILGTIVSALGATLIALLSRHKEKNPPKRHFEEQSTCNISSTAHGLFCRFSATLIHDLKQPISAIQFNALAALRFIHSSASGSHPEVTESLEDIKNDVARLSRLAQGLGAFLGIEREQDEALDLNFEIETALSLLKGEMMKRQINYQTQLRPLNSEFIWKRPILSRTVLSVTLSLMDALVAIPDKSKTIHISTNVTESKKVEILFQAESFTTKPPLNIQLCIQDVHKRGGTLSDSLSETGFLTVILAIPFTSAT